MTMLMCMGPCSDVATGAGSARRGNGCGPQHMVALSFNFFGHCKFRKK
uniref:Alternative protein n=1 Tax=Meloidogyne hapla TaxID=6305 RepID=A0A1I8BEB3_MELHA